MSIAKTSRLNPNAKEFVPSGEKIPQSTTSEGLTNNMIKKYLSITILESGTTHSGYCSDPVDITSYENIFFDNFELGGFLIAINITTIIQNTKSITHPTM